MKRMIARLALITGLAMAALLFTTGGGSSVEAAAYPYCGPATGPCYGYGGYGGYAGYTGYPYTSFVNTAIVNPIPYRVAYVPTQANYYAANGCALGNYTCMRNNGITYAPYWWWGR